MTAVTPVTLAAGAGGSIPYAVSCRPVSRLVRRLLPLVLLAAACQPSASRRGATVLFASGADLQSINPLLTLHPLARQVQRYVLLVTLARYDSALTPRPYLARRWEWSAQGRVLTFHLETAARWHDGVPTTAADVKWTLDAARSPETGYPRATDLAALDSVHVLDDSTLTLGFSVPPSTFPDVLTDLAVLPAHLLDTVPQGHLREAAWNNAPVGNGPFRFVAHEANRRWVFTANRDFPPALGGPPRLDRFIVVVVDEPTTKLAALTAGELDMAGIQPAHATFVERDRALAVMTYPLLQTYGIVLNTRHPPFDRPEVRRAIDRALDRREIVDGYLYGFGTPARGPVPPDVPGYLPVADAAGGPITRPVASAAAVAFELLTVGSGEAALEQMVQAQLARAGFKVTIRQLELSAFLARVYGPAHDFDAAVLGISGDAGLGYLGPLAALAGMTAPAGAAATQRFFADSVPVAFLYHARGLQGVNRRVLGVTMDLRGELPTVHDWSVSR
ncbi:MAG TPA: ABC transporter substrate-binding protein [Gemmatimonadales bacterium]|jgi:peptide/nickel transport system substrate-binding protein